MKRGIVTTMMYILGLLLAITFVLPIISRTVEKNLEIFLFIVGVLASIISGTLNKELIIDIVENKFMYIIALAVLLGGLLFKLLYTNIKEILADILKYVPLRVFVFLLVVIIGLLSSVITAIIAALLLVEIVSILPISRKNKINIDIVSCFSIGLGAALTPMGEPLATNIVSKLHVEFWFILKHFSIYIIPGILILGIIGAFYAKQGETDAEERENVSTEETNKVIFVRALKILLFIAALELLGEGFKPIVDNYIMTLDMRYLFWVNMSSAVLDNATLAAAEISAQMTQAQIKAILMALLISGGMMIPGNIPNIISAGKLKIKTREWIRVGIPLGMSIMSAYYVVLFGI